MITFTQIPGGIALNDALPAIDNNFKQMAADLQQFNVALDSVSGFGAGISIAASTQEAFIFNISSRYPSAQIGGILITCAYYIDDPALAHGTTPTPGHLYEWPNGSALTTSQKQVSFSFNNYQWGNYPTQAAEEAANPGSTASFVFEGETWYPTQATLMGSIRNRDISPHVYSVFVNCLMIGTPQPDQFR